jgi:hypothetical protein
MTPLPLSDEESDAVMRAAFPLQPRPFSEDGPGLP